MCCVHLISIFMVSSCACLSGSAASAEGQKGDRRQKLLERFDENGNGQLDPEERDRIREQLKQRRKPGPLGRAGQAGQDRHSRDTQKNKKRRGQKRLSGRGGGQNTQGRPIGPGGKAPQGRLRREQVPAQFGANGDRKLGRSERQQFRGKTKRRRGRRRGQDKGPRGGPKGGQLNFSPDSNGGGHAGSRSGGGSRKKMRRPGGDPGAESHLGGLANRRKNKRRGG